jgi:UDP-N-acetylglucosamine 2-epimerase
MFLRVPCLTLRPVIERPVTVSSGSNRLVRIVTAWLATRH